MKLKRKGTRTYSFDSAWLAYGSLLVMIASAWVIFLMLRNDAAREWLVIPITTFAGALIFCVCLILIDRHKTKRLEKEHNDAFRLRKALFPAS